MGNSVQYALRMGVEGKGERGCREPGPDLHLCRQSAPFQSLMNAWRQACYSSAPLNQLNTTPLDTWQQTRAPSGVNDAVGTLPPLCGVWWGAYPLVGPERRISVRSFAGLYVERSAECKGHVSRPTGRRPGQTRTLVLPIRGNDALSRLILPRREASCCLSNENRPATVRLRRYYTIPHSVKACARSAIAAGIPDSTAPVMAFPALRGQISFHTRFRTWPITSQFQSVGRFPWLLLKRIDEETEKDASIMIIHPGNRVVRCRWLSGFLGDLPFPPPLHSGTAPNSLQSPSSALKTPLSRLADPEKRIFLHLSRRNIVVTTITFSRTSWINENVLDGTYLKYKHHVRVSEEGVIKSREFGVSCDLKRRLGDSGAARDDCGDLRECVGELVCNVKSRDARSFHSRERITVNTTWPMGTLGQGSAAESSMAEPTSKQASSYVTKHPSNEYERGKREIPKKTRRPAASSGTIPTCENLVARIAPSLLDLGRVIPPVVHLALDIDPKVRSVGKGHPIFPKRIPVELYYNTFKLRSTFAIGWYQLPRFLGACPRITDGPYTIENFQHLTLSLDLAFAFRHVSYGASHNGTAKGNCKHFTISKKLKFQVKVKQPFYRDSNRAVALVVGTRASASPLPVPLNCVRGISLARTRTEADGAIRHFACAQNATHHRPQCRPPPCPRFVGNLPFPSPLHSGRCSILTSITLIGSQDVVKSRTKARHSHFTHSHKEVQTSHTSLIDRLQVFHIAYSVSCDSKKQSHCDVSPTKLRPSTARK
ncbi:hypothetical protein PR048_010430 [Dryococelus australis]|uniref:Uncharacterized protein n=1 Tax=Dryococelus australis TaxID=614101 RepID=A0ABQ9I2R6_9NEOP|nr:hypothetical protein PR048_010430 [Dryococelus australis]